MNRLHRLSIFQAILAAALFGASAPLAKLLLGEVEPITLAAFLYLGSGLSLLLIKTLQNLSGQPQQGEAQIQNKEYGWLFGAVVSGGVLAPIVLLFALKETPAATASLLLNFEGVATTLIAAIVFKESISRRVMWAVGAITLASILLSMEPGQRWGLSIGALGIILACVLWGIDNNFTRNISAKDPFTIVLIKGFGAGTFSLLLSLILGNPLPNIGVLFGALLLGGLSYGASIVLFIHAMRNLGAARTSALFGTAPLIGMILSLALFHKMPDWIFFLAVPIMVAGAFLLLNEDHQHPHIHPAEVHEHRHSHDDGHHLHGHPESELSCDQHSHPHEHQPLEHIHPHTPDINHRHSHQVEG